MGVFSTIRVEDRFEIQDTLSRFCHALDQNDARQWARLFRPDSIVNAPRLGRYVGLREIEQIPGKVMEIGAGAWRHYLNNVAMTALRHRWVQVDAYCLVSNWKAGGQIVRSWDLRSVLAKGREWQIAELTLSAVTGRSAVMPAPEGG